MLTPSSNPVVIVPVHKEMLTQIELISLRQCQKILGLRKIYVVAPEGTKLDVYMNILKTASVMFVPKKMMSSPAEYNKLMISSFFFEKFQKYSHLLIHELDAIALKDDLDYWCQQPYSYIGAPWFKKDNHGAVESFPGGNYGFSLINIEDANRVLSSQKRWYSFINIFRDLIRGVRGKPYFFNRAMQGIGKAGLMIEASSMYFEHCDIFWSVLVPKLFTDFSVAPPEQAIYFSWETFPVICSERCNEEKPFGVHAWAKHNPIFIQKILLSQGIDLDDPAF